jgi:tetratricopeptide (TPR) repeat protein
VLFERALAAAPITLPAHVTLFTGQYPFAHGVRNNGDFALAEGIPTLATALHDRGYRTAAFVSSFVLDRRFGLARGFDLYDDQLDSAADGAGALERRGDRTAAAAGEWLDAQTGSAAPFFLWIHLYDPHDPYDPPPPYRAQFADRPYDGEIAFDDAMIDGVLERLQRLGLLASTAVAVVGDHGESLGEHEEATHSLFVYQATLRVPLILWWPGHLPAGQRVPSPVRGIDVAPTLLDLAGVRRLDSAQGTTLLPRVRGAAGDGGSAFASAYAETYFPLFYMNWAPLRSIQDERWKFIDAPEPELYDLSRDPQERSNLAAREPSRVTALRRAVDALTGGNSGAMSARAVDAGTAAKLAALGYVGAVGSGTATAAHDGNRPDPKRMIGVFNRLRAANAAARDARHAEAETIARDALAGDPSNAFATIVLANAEMAQGRYAHAIADYRAYAALVPHSAEPHHRIAICYARLGETDKALAEEDAAKAIDPRDPDVRNHRGGLLAARGRVDEAIAELRAAVEIVPDNALFRVGLARVLLSAGRLDEADAELQHALRRAANSPDAHAAYGALFVARHRPDRAIEEFRRALATRPEADDVRFDYAMALERAGRGAEARREYERLSSGRETPSDIRQAARARLQ